MKLDDDGGMILWQTTLSAAMIRCRKCWVDKLRISICGKRTWPMVFLNSDRCFLLIFDLIPFAIFFFYLSFCCSMLLYHIERTSTWDLSSRQSVVELCRSCLSLLLAFLSFVGVVFFSLAVRGWGKTLQFSSPTSSVSRKWRRAQSKSSGRHWQNFPTTFRREDTHHTNTNNLPDAEEGSEKENNLFRQISLKYQHHTQFQSRTFLIARAPEPDT